jgi:hypothetical protein
MSDEMILKTPINDGSKIIVVEDNPKYIFVTSEKQLEELEVMLDPNDTKGVN